VPQGEALNQKQDNAFILNKAEEVVQGEPPNLTKQDQTIETPHKGDFI